MSRHHHPRPQDHRGEDEKTNALIIGIFVSVLLVCLGLILAGSNN